MKLKHFKKKTGKNTLFHPFTDKDFDKDRHAGNLITS